MNPEPPTRPRTQPDRRSERSFPEDLALVRAGLRGDAEALDTFVKRLRCVPRYLSSRNQRWGNVLAEHELCDLVQDVLTVLWRKRATYEGRGPLESWACATSLLQYCNRVRRRRQRRTIDIEDVPLEAEPAVTPADPFDRAIVQEALDELEEPDRSIIYAKHFESRTFAEIGAVLEMSSNTAKSRYYRGLEVLRRRLAGVLDVGDA